MIETAAIVVGSILYSFFALATARSIAGHLAWKAADNWNQKKPDGGDWFFAWIGGLIAATCFPIFVIGYLGAKYAPAIGAEKKAQIKADKKRLKELDKWMDEEVEKN